MVNVGQKYNLNHIYKITDNQDYLLSPEIALGAAAGEIVYILTLFEKSLALTSDLKRLPILRSLSFSTRLHPDWIGRLTSAGIATAVTVIYIYNEEITNDELTGMGATGQFARESLIWSGCIITSVATSNQVISRDFPTWDYEGGYLLNNKISVVLRTVSNAVTSGAAYPTGTHDVLPYFEIDWVPVSKAEFQEFILENVYAKAEF